MKTAVKSRPEAELGGVLEKLFDRMPHLIGFSVRDMAGDVLCLYDVETLPWGPAPQELLAEIAGPLAELMEESSLACELLRGRTFARALH